MSGDYSGYYEDSHGNRTYDDGTREWHKKWGGDWTRYSDSNGNSGWERQRDDGWTKRQTDNGDKSWGKDVGGGWTRWDDGSYTKKR